LVCSSCGFVVRDRVMDLGPEWRSFNQEQWEGRCRAGPPATPMIHDKGLSTVIDWRDCDSHGKVLTPKRRTQIYRLRKWQRRTRVSNATERNLAFALSELNRMSSQLGLPRGVRETAAVIYRRVAEHRLVRGRSIEGVVAAVLYTACRGDKISRTLNEIANVSRVGKKEVERNFRFIARKLSIRQRSTNPAEYIPRFGDKLGLSGEAQAKAVVLIERAEKKKLVSGRNPAGIAAAALYVAGCLTGENRSQVEAADAAGVTEVTLRNVKNELCREPRIEKSEFSMQATKVQNKKSGRILRKRPQIKIQNLVLSVTWENTKFDLKKLVGKLESAQYDPNEFPGMSYRFGEPPVSFLIFKSGKANCVGAKSTRSARMAIDELTRRLRHSGIGVPNPKIKVQNLVASLDYGADLDIEEIARTHENAEYHPESFPGLTLRLNDPKVVVLLFASGKGVCAGAKNMRNVKKAAKKVARLLSERRRREPPPPARCSDVKIRGLPSGTT